MSLEERNMKYIRSKNMLMKKKGIKSVHIDDMLMGKKLNYEVLI